MEKIPKPNVYVLIMMAVVVLGFIENRPIDAFIIAVLFTIASIVSYVPFIGFWLFMYIVNAIYTKWIWLNGLAAAAAYWATTIWSLMVCIASTALVVLRILRR